MLFNDDVADSRCVCTVGGRAASREIRALIPSATKNTKATKVNDDLQWNDLLNTGPKGRLRAGLTDGSILSLGSSSELRVVQHDATSQQTSLEMNLGKVRSKVVKITQPGGKFEVKTANAVIGVIGTDFYVSYDPGKTTVICYTGKVAVTPIGDAKIIKNSGESTQDQVMVNAGQMVVISSAIPPAGFDPSPRQLMCKRASIEDTTRLIASLQSDIRIWYATLLLGPQSPRWDGQSARNSERVHRRSSKGAIRKTVGADNHLLYHLQASLFSGLR